MDIFAIFSVFVFFRGETGHFEMQDVSIFDTFIILNILKARLVRDPPSNKGVLTLGPINIDFPLGLIADAKIPPDFDGRSVWFRSPVPPSLDRKKTHAIKLFVVIVV